MLVKLLFVGFLLAHAAVHLMFFVPKPAATAGAPTWPFEIGRSWALSPVGVAPDTLRVLGIALVALVFAGYALVAISALGVGPAGLWIPGVVIGAVASLLLLGLWYQPWLTIGVAIDLVLLWLVLVSSWAPEGLAR